MQVDPVVSEVVAVAAAIDGVVGVALGGSRGAGTADEHSDWDVGVYYRGDLDHDRLAAFGEVHPPGAWGRVMNGGAWLRHRGVRIDVVLRDADAVDHWTAEATRGRYEVDGLPGYLAGIPTYTLAAELSVNRVLTGAVPSAIAFPELLATAAGGQWRFRSWFSVEHARMRARRGDVAGTLGHLGRAAVEAGHAILCDRREWAINEKGLVDRAGLGAVHDRMAAVESDVAALVACVDDVGAALRAA
jgi:predicted nucleotidyltransferase